MSKKRARRHHVVSNFYLKGFANDEGHLTQIHLPGDRRHTVDTGSATVATDFYTVQLPDGSPSDVVEEAFADIEGPASTALRAVLEGEWPVRMQHREDLAAWLALQYLRGTGMRSSQTQMRAQMLKLIVGVSGKDALRSHIEAAEGSKLSNEDLDAEWNDIIKPGGPDLEEDGMFHIAMIFDMWPGLTNVFAQTHWSLIRFERRSLLTSDHPVALFAHPDHPDFLGVGVLNAAGVIAPLSRRLALQISYDLKGMPEPVVPGSTTLARAINGQVLNNARRFVYHHPEDDPLVGLDIPGRRTRELGGESDHLIHEDGAFGQVSERDLEAMGRIAAVTRHEVDEDGEDGMTLHDVPWPIPGRMNFVRPSTRPQDSDGSDPT